jgi:hypothetical protein
LVIGVGAVVLAALFAAGIRARVPDCADPRTKALVVQILRQMEVQGDLVLSNVTSRADGWLEPRYECQAEVVGITEGRGFLALLGLRQVLVTYRSEVTEDTRQHYVTARLGARQ